MKNIMRKYMMLSVLHLILLTLAIPAGSAFGLSYTSNIGMININSDHINTELIYEPLGEGLFFSNVFAGHPEVGMLTDEDSGFDRDVTAMASFDDIFTVDYVTAGAYGRIPDAPGWDVSLFDVAKTQAGYLPTFAQAQSYYSQDYSVSGSGEIEVTVGWGAIQELSTDHQWENAWGEIHFDLFLLSQGSGLAANHLVISNYVENGEFYSDTSAGDLSVFLNIEDGDEISIAARVMVQGRTELAPEPSSMLLLGLGVLGLAGVMRKFKKK
ncbi:MAG: PEP-CTERM sorting domain-containing protein [Desulfobacterales bacterium]|nr:PEP-CTERM sorting domain-containing protein [Desulfobacterales bacterium]